MAFPEAAVCNGKRLLPLPSLGKIQRYDPYYQNPRGTFEKILGDASFNLIALYRVIPRLSVGIRAGFVTTGGTAVVSYNRANVTKVTIFPSDLTKTIEQKMRLDVLHYGVGLQYALNLCESLQLSASTKEDLASHLAWTFFAESMAR